MLNPSLARVSLIDQGHGLSATPVLTHRRVLSDARGERDFGFAPFQFSNYTIETLQPPEPAIGTDGLRVLIEKSLALRDGFILS